MNQAKAEKPNYSPGLLLFNRAKAEKPNYSLGLLLFNQLV